MASDSLSPDGRPSPSVAPAIVIFGSLTLYNALELSVIIYTTFKRSSTLYFWSFVTSTFGLVPQSIIWLLKASSSFQLGSTWPTIVLIGWICMVTGQSLVLYSRLHIICQSEARLRLVRNVIIFDAFALHIPTIVFSFGRDYANSSGRFDLAMAVFEKIQVSGFFLQEVFISGIYIWETVAWLKARKGFGPGEEQRGRRMMVHLVLVNVVVLVLDITILVLECVGLRDVQRAYKFFAYSVKLKVEFSILNQLVELTTGGGRGAFPWN
ncbi:hypothetical protein OQA88_1796 [Cercophora sp. LCS_1]